VNKQNDLAALFALARYDWEKMSLEAGARGEHHQRYGGFFTPESTLSFYPSDELKWHTKVSRGYKSPSLYQLYAPDTFGPLGNSELTPETNKSMEVGVTWKSAGVLSLVAFQQDYQNLILYSSTDGYLNGGDLRVQGIESQIISPMHSWGQVSVSWTQLDFSHFDETPIRRPPYLATLNWSQEWGKWKSELRLRAVGGRKDRVNSKNVSLIAYETLSGSLRYEATQNQQWVLNAGNLTDRVYEDIWGYSVAPLNLSLQWLGKF
jgi:outer membrane cobalamin receptor